MSIPNTACVWIFHHTNSSLKCLTYICSYTHLVFRFSIRNTNCYRKVHKKQSASNQILIFVVFFLFHKTVDVIMLLAFTTTFIWKFYSFNVYSRSGGKTTTSNIQIREYIKQTPLQMHSEITCFSEQVKRMNKAYA
jgi:hypothetical protein